jgi:tRNA-dihydrouridine synthase
MITSRALVERTPMSLRMITHDPDESPRSVQLYGVDPATVRAAVRMSVRRTAPTTSTSTSAARCPR